MAMKVLLKILAFVLIALQPIYDQLIAMFIFMVIDMVTGTWKAIKHKDFKARKFAHSVGKFILYMTAVIVAQIADTAFGLPKIAQLLISAIVIIELTSILENIKEITGLDVLGKIVDLVKRKHV